MPQIYNLGGVTIQGITTLDIARIYNAGATHTIIDSVYQPSAAGMPAYTNPPFRYASLQNIEFIISKSGREIAVDRIKESTN